MSVTITARAVRPTAYGDWATIDERLTRTAGDWPHLRAGLIHLVCERIASEGENVSRLEEVLLQRRYQGGHALPASVCEELLRVRRPLEAWGPQEAQDAERAIAASPHCPTRPGEIDLRSAAGAPPSGGAGPGAASRGLQRFFSTGRSACVCGAREQN
jgi:hypothetical protein